jgi:hypothetical protein
MGAFLFFWRFRLRGLIGGGVNRAHCAQMLLGEGRRTTRNKEVGMWPLVLAAPHDKKTLFLLRPDQSPSRVV